MTMHKTKQYFFISLGGLNTVELTAFLFGLEEISRYILLLFTFCLHSSPMPRQRANKCSILSPCSVCKLLDNTSEELPKTQHGNVSVVFNSWKQSIKLTYQLRNKLVFIKPADQNVQHHQHCGLQRGEEETHTSVRLLNWFKVSSERRGFTWFSLLTILRNGGKPT